MTTSTRGRQSWRAMKRSRLSTGEPNPGDPPFLSGSGAGKHQSPSRNLSAQGTNASSFELSNTKTNAARDRCWRKRPHCSNSSAVGSRESTCWNKATINRTFSETSVSAFVPSPCSKRSVSDSLSLKAPCQAKSPFISESACDATIDVALLGQETEGSGWSNVSIQGSFIPRLFTK